MEVTFFPIGEASAQRRNLFPAHLDRRGGLFLFQSRFDELEIDVGLPTSLLGRLNRELLEDTSGFLLPTLPEEPSR